LELGVLAKKRVFKFNDWLDPGKRMFYVLGKMTIKHPSASVEFQKSQASNGILQLGFMFPPLAKGD